MQGLVNALPAGTSIDVPHVGRCRIRSILEPAMYSSNWWTHVEIAFPGDSSSQMTIGMHTFASGLMDDTESIDLPAPTYADKNDDLYPKEHEAAWYRALDRLEHELKSRGVNIGSSDDNDVHITSNYMPSDGSSARRLAWSLCIQRASILAGISSPPTNIHGSTSSPRTGTGSGRQQWRNRRNRNDEVLI
jgi:hypothetical protein